MQEHIDAKTSTATLKAPQVLPFQDAVSGLEVVRCGEHTAHLTPKTLGSLQASIL